MKHLLTTLVLFFATISFAQIKVFQNGNIGVANAAYNANIPNNESLVIEAQKDARGILVKTDHDYSWWQAIATHVNDSLTVSYVMRYNNQDNFWVDGNGLIYSRVGSYVVQTDGALENLGITNSLERLMDLVPVENNILGNLVPTIETESFTENFPDLTTITGDGETAFNYTALIPVLIQGLQEQQNIISNLENTVKDLTNTVNNLLPFGNSGGIFLNQNTSNNALGLKNQSEENEQTNLVDNNTDFLLQNHPNPFNEKTTIEYTINSNTIEAELMIFDLQGSLALTKALNTQTGKNNITIQAGELKPGMYYYSLVVNGELKDTKRMIISE